MAKLLDMTPFKMEELYHLLQLLVGNVSNMFVRVSMTPAILQKLFLWLKPWIRSTPYSAYSHGCLLLLPKINLLSPNVLPLFGPSSLNSSLMPWLKILKRFKLSIDWIEVVIIGIDILIYFIFKIPIQSFTSYNDTFMY